MPSGYEIIKKSIKNSDDSVDKSIKKQVITIQDVIILIFGFIICRGTFTSYLMPFGFPFIAYILFNDRKKWWLGISVILGVASTGQVIYVVEHLLVFAIMFFGFIRLHEYFNVKWKMSVYAFLSTVLGSFIINFFTGGFLFDYALSLLEGLLAFSLFYIYDSSMNLIVNSNRKMFSNQEIMCLGIFLSILIIGIKDIYIYNLSLSSILSVFIILLFSYEIGLTVSGPLGMTLGLVMNLGAGANPIFIVIYGLCGIISGLFKEAGKLFVILGFVISNAMLAFYFNGSTEVYIHIEEIAISSLFFLFIPHRLWDKLNLFNSENVQDDYQQFYKERVHENLRIKINQYSQLFRELGVTFVDDGQEAQSEQLYIDAIENIMEKACSDCYLISRCWKIDGEKTVGVIKDTLDQCQNGEDNNFNRLKNMCIFDEKILKLIKYESEYISFHKNIINRIHDNNLLVAKQLQYTGDLLNDLKTRMYEGWYIKNEEEKDLMIEFDKQKIGIEQIFVMQENNDRYKITLLSNRCKNENLCNNVIPGILSDVLNRKIILNNKICYFENSRSCKMVFSEMAEYRITTGISRYNSQLQENSGDIFSDKLLDNGCRVLALCDGMGTGNKAYKESEPTISLLEKFLEAGIDKTIMVKTINSILMLRNERETFSTLDYVMFDQYSGIAEFNKVGASITIIITNDDVKLIRGQSLPVGILNEIKIESVEMKLQEGNCVIMMTDGIFECNENPNHVENWVLETIKKISTRNPQKMADELYNYFLDICPYPKDDITIMVGKVWKT